MSDLRYPVGKFHYEGSPSPEQHQAFLDEIAKTPANLRASVRGLSEAQLDTPYRPDGWTVRQVVHHVPDSHLNSYVRFKLALTEDAPTIKPYAEDRWAELADSKATPIEVSLTLPRVPARPLGPPAAVADSRTMEAYLPPSRDGADDPGENACALCMARAPSCGSRYRTAQTDVVVACRHEDQPDDRESVARVHQAGARGFL